MRDRRLTLALLVAAGTLVAASLPTAASPLGPGPAQASGQIVLSVDATAGRHRISPYIYGLNFAGRALGAAIDVSVDRWGGNVTDTYNWRLGSGNSGADYYFENVADCFSAARNYDCGGRRANNVFAYRDFIANDRRLHARTLLTLPMMGYVAKNAPVAHPFTCGYPRSQFPGQDSFDPFDSNCGNGLRNGARIRGANPGNDGVPVDPSFYRGWLADLRTRYGDAARGGVAMYELGNEPALWSSTHSDMHPAPETAAELWRKSRDLATAVKTADPTAQVLGFSDWGWPAYFCTDADRFGNGCDAHGCTSSPDCANHGRLPVVEWLLKRFASYDASTRKRHLDYIDVHYYTQGGSTPDVTRSLWDATFTDPSWIASRIDLIPRMKRWVARYYPGTRISLSEYNLSVNGDAVTNALIQADTLGIFAREGLDLATRWPLDRDGNLIGDAFRVFRNYDGKHSKFGDTWIRSTSSDQSRLAVYGAQRSRDGAYTVLVLNKTTSPVTGALRLKGIGSPPRAQTWIWTGNGIHLSGSTPIRSQAVDATYPGRSMTLYVIR
jgi:hypothetical protein